MPFKRLFILLCVVVVLFSTALIGYFFNKDRQQTSIIKTESQKLQTRLEANSTATKEYVQKYPLDSQKLEGAILSQTFPNQVWIFGKIEKMKLDLATSTGTFTISVLNNLLNFDVNDKTIYLENNSDITKSSILSARDFTIGDKVQVTFSDSNLNSTSNPISIYIKKL